MLTHHMDRAVIIPGILHVTITIIIHLITLVIPDVMDVIIAAVVIIAIIITPAISTAMITPAITTDQEDQVEPIWFQPELPIQSPSYIRMPFEQNL